MSTKDALMELVRRLPDDVTADEALDELAVRLKVEEGLRQLDAGEGIPHEEVKARLARWLD